MIIVICKTNLDNYQREIWPGVMACLPRVGDKVKSRSGKMLKVVSVTHTTIYQSENDVPVIEVELNN